MGRKIPARKHHGVRDPLKQMEQRLALIKDKINNPPEKRDYQKVSHKLADFIKLKEEAKSGITPLKRYWHADEDKPENYKTKKPTHRHNKELPDIKRFANEDEAAYLKRVNRLTRASIQETQFENKYGVEVIRNKQTGAITLKKRPKDELEEQMKQARKKQKYGKRKAEELEPILKPDERNKLAKEALKKKRKEKEVDSIEEFKRDVIKFGEIVHAPPHLSVPRLGKKAETVPRPGKKPLLLHSLLDGENAKESEQQPSKKPQSSDLKGKRKDLSTVTRQMIETQQKNAVELYRQLKKSKRQQET